MKVRPKNKMNKMNRMNKKGIVLHWSIFLVLVGIFLFLAISLVRGGVTEVKGEWHLNFLKQHYVEAEKVLLRSDGIAKNVGTEISWALAQNGGFLEQRQSSCGKINGVNLWNLGKQWCAPEVYGPALEIATTLISQRIPERTYTNLSFQNNFFQGRGPLETISSDLGNYTFDTSFIADLGYSFEEYEQLKGDAYNLLLNCGGNVDLQQCLQKTKPSFWHFSSCEEPQFKVDNNRVVFCVQSPNLAKLPFGSSLFRLLIPITYNLALDFSVTGPPNTN